MWECCSTAHASILPLPGKRLQQKTFYQREAKRSLETESGSHFRAGIKHKGLHARSRGLGQSDYEAMEKEGVLLGSFPEGTLAGESLASYGRLVWFQLPSLCKVYLYWFLFWFFVTKFNLSCLGRGLNSASGKCHARG